MTGFRDKIDFMANIKAAKEIFGKGMHLFTIIDSTYLDKQIRKDAWEQLKDEKVEGFMNSKRIQFQGMEGVCKKDKSYTYFCRAYCPASEGSFGCRTTLEFEPIHKR